MIELQKANNQRNESLYLQRWGERLIQIHHMTKIHPVTHAFGQFKRLNSVSLTGTRTLRQI